MRCTQKSIRDKRIPREAFFDLGDVKLRTSLLPFMIWRKKTFSWRKDLKLNAARCFSGTHATMRLTEETVVTSGSCVKRVLVWAMSRRRKTLSLSTKRRMKTLSWRKDLKLNATRCFTGTQATVSSTQETFVTSGSRVKRDLTWAMSKRRKTL